MAPKPIPDIKLLVEHSGMGHTGKLVWVTQVITAGSFMFPARYHYENYYWSL